MTSREAVLTLREAGVRPADIARRVGISRQRVYQLTHGDVHRAYQRAHRQRLKARRRAYMRALCCRQCGHRWWPRGPQVAQCPNCHTPFWDRRRPANAPGPKPRRFLSSSRDSGAPGAAIADLNPSRQSEREEARA